MKVRQAAVIQCVWPEQAAEYIRRAQALGADVTRPTPVTVLATWGTAPRLTHVAVVEGAELLGHHRNESALADTLVSAVGRGAAGIASLAGDNTFVSCEPTRAVIARSCVGLGQWYVYASPVEVVATTHLGLVEQLIETELPVDPLVLAAWTTASVFPWDRSPLAGVRVLAPGHFAELRTGSSNTFIRYWNPAEIEQQPPDPTSPRARVLRREVIASVARDLDDNGPNLAMFSGGVASSTLVALALRQNKVVHTSSVVPTRDYARHQPVYESINGLLRQVSVAGHSLEPLNEFTVIETLLKAPRTRLPITDAALVVGAQRAVEVGAGVLFGGALAGELFGGPNMIYTDWVGQLSAGDLARVAKNEPTLDRKRATQAWFAAQRRRRNGALALPFAAQLPTFVRAELRAEYAEWIAEVRGVSTWRRHPRAFTLAMLDHGYGRLTQQWEVAGALGLSVSAPFASRRLAELSLECHPFDLALPPQRLLHRSFGDMVPASHLLHAQQLDSGHSPASLTSRHLPGHGSVTARLEPVTRALPGPLPVALVAALAPLVVAAQPAAQPAAFTSAHRAWNRSTTPGSPVTASW